MAFGDLSQTLAALTVFSDRGTVQYKRLAADTRRLRGLDSYTGGTCNYCSCQPSGLAPLDGTPTALSASRKVGIASALKQYNSTSVADGRIRPGDTGIERPLDIPEKCAIPDAAMEPFGGRISRSLDCCQVVRRSIAQLSRHLNVVT